jgi:hypothetical protein
MDGVAMRVLVVGDGPLGQVFGLWLTEGGASVTYLVKPGRDGWEERTLYRLRRVGRPVPRRLRPAQVVTELDGGSWDMVWLCVSSIALRGPWLRELAEKAGDATIVSVGQDVHDRAVLGEVWPSGRIVQVAPAVLAYAAPLAGEVPAPGVAYWTPPGAANGVSGERAASVVAALRGTRSRVARRPGAGEAAAARMMPYIAALEAAGWSLPELRAGLGLPTAAAAEAVRIVGGRTPALMRPAAGLVLRLLPWLAPFDLPRYLEAHFTKVAAQTRLMLDGWIAEGTSSELPVTRLRELRDALSAKMTS